VARGIGRLGAIAARTGGCEAGRGPGGSVCSGRQQAQRDGGGWRVAGGAPGGRGAGRLGPAVARQPDSGVGRRRL